MQFKSALLGIVLALGMANATASDLYKPNRFDRFQAYFTNSYAAQVVKYLARPLDWLLGKILRINHGTASAEYQHLGKQAQIDLGTHPKLTVPIKRANNVEFAGLVHATNGSIYVNENSYNNQSYGSRNHVLHHEAVHIKYADGPSKVVALGTWALIATAGNQIAKTFCNKHDVIDAATIIIALSSVYYTAKYSYYCEHRADTEGLYATNCFVCASDTKKREQKRKEDITKYGYLSVKEIEQIEQHLKAHNRICLYHINEKKQKFFDNKKEILAPFKRIKEIKSILPKLSYYKQFASNS
ncbi:MAG: hypothetical protein ACOYT8_05195 [Candidatus Dependentiae bacterium]